MLFRKAVERRRRETKAESRRLTTAVANAIAITLDKQARASYDRATAREDAAQGAPGQTVAEFRATLARLQADPAMRGAVKVH